MEQGTPADLFLSASEKEIHQLVQKGIIDSEQHYALLSNRLVLSVTSDSTKKIKQLSDLYSDKIKRIAIGHLDTVPAGYYAKQLLEKSGLWKQIYPKLLWTSNVRQTLASVETGNVDAGFVYLSDVQSNRKVTTSIILNPKLHSPIIYRIGMIKNTLFSRQTEAFYRWLHGSEASHIFLKYGFTVVA